MTKINIVSTSILILSLYGCASGAKYENMVYIESSGMTYDESLKNDVMVNPVQGGEETNPLWTSEISAEAFQKAVEMSLSSQKLLSGNGRYKLKVILSKVDQPMFGLDLTVTTNVNYVLVDTETDKIIFDEDIVAPFTATFSDSALAVKRLRLANEGSGKKNIEGLLKKLSTLNISKSNITLTK